MQFKAGNAVFTLTSPLHDEREVASATQEFLGSLGMEFLFRGADYQDYGAYDVNLIYVRTGGTEGVFKSLLPQLCSQSSRPFYLLTSGKSNSLAASMEILSYLRRQGLKGEIIHGSVERIVHRLRLLAQVETAIKKLRGLRLGVIGQPSDWLISSDADSEKVMKRLGVELVSVPMDELVHETVSMELLPVEETASDEKVRAALPDADRIYRALKRLVAKYRLQGLTIRCFDLLTTVHNTGCLALARLNAEGIVAGCEGDVPAMLSMVIARALTGSSSFQANPATINPETGEMLLAHCTIPLDMVERYELDTHFESGIGVAIRGYVAGGPVTVYKISGDVSRQFVAEGCLSASLSQPGLCRTQLAICLDDTRQVDYFLNDPIGNHHIVIKGHHQELFEQLFLSL